MKLRGFTIVELLVVIIVIAVSVTLSIVGYSGISSKATVSALQSDLTNAKKQLLAYQAQSTTNSFPTAINCTNPSATEICIRPSNSSTTLTYVINNSVNPPNFNLTATNSSTKYWINSGSGPLTTPDVVTDGLIMYLDAANPTSYSGSGSTWYDLSGNNRNATKAGSQSPTYPQWNGSGYFEFTGGIYGNNYSRFDVALPALNAVTLMTFQYSTVGGGHVLRGGNDSYQIGPDGYAAGLQFNDINCARLDVLNTWISDAVTFDGINLAGYRNGSLYSSRVRSSSTALASGTLRIGARSDYFTNHFFGKIPVVMVYSRALNASEISQNFNAFRNRYGI